MYKKSLKNPHNNLKELFKKHGLKLTPQRIAIYNEIMDSKEHPSTVYIFERMRNLFPNISFDTVNRTLNTFVKIGLIKNVEYSGDSKRFDINMNKHHHFICIKCGRIVDFESKEFDNLKMPNAINSKFEIIDHKVLIEGICDRCKK